MSTAELAGQTAEPAVSAVAVRDLQVVIEAPGTPVISDVSFEIAGGSVLLGDRDILTLGEEQLRRLRGSLVSYVPQDPASSLNPALRIGTQLSKVIQAHGNQPD